MFPLLGLRTEPNADEGFHASLGASVMAHPMVILNPTGIVDLGLAYSLPVSDSLTPAARVGPSVFASLGGGGYYQAGAHGGVSVLLGSASPRLRLEYTARAWFVDGEAAGWPVLHGRGVGLTWGGGG